MKTSMWVPETLSFKEMVGRVETSARIVSDSCTYKTTVWRTVGEEQHVSFHVAGAIVGYDEVS